MKWIPDTYYVSNMNVAYLFPILDFKKFLKLEKREKRERRHMANSPK